MNASLPMNSIVPPRPNSEGVDPARIAAELKEAEAKKAEALKAARFYE